MKPDLKKLAGATAHHGSILLRGFVKMLFGTATAALIVVATYGFLMIPYDEGYWAVGSFMISAVSMAVALTCVYLMGGRCRKGSHARK